MEASEFTYRDSATERADDPDRSSLGLTLGAIEKTVAGLHEDFSKLEAHLAPVLTPRPEIATSEIALKATHPERSEAVKRANDIGTELNALSYRISDLRARLEV
jgi:hypothetical protein